MKSEERLGLVWEAVLAMAPAFRDKFDFSDGTMPGEKNQYQRLSEMAFSAADALVADYEAREIKAAYFESQVNPIKEGKK